MTVQQVKQDRPAVTIALRQDEEEIMEQCRRLHKENGLFTLNDAKVRKYLRLCYARENANATPVIVGVIKNKGRIEASTCLMVSDFYYTDDWHLAELWNFVDEPYRKSHNAEALIEFGKVCSDKMKIPFFTGIITNKQMAGKVRLYRRLLGYPTGAFFIHGAKWTSEPMQDHTDLRRQLKEYAQLCNDSRVSAVVARQKLGPLLREAAEAIAGEDNVWGAAAAPKKLGAQVRGAA